MQKRWEVDDEGPVSDLLNIEIRREKHKVVLRQTAYIEKMVHQRLPDGVPSQIQVMGSTPHVNELPALVQDAVTCKDSVDPVLHIADIKASSVACCRNLCGH